MKAVMKALILVLVEVMVQGIHLEVKIDVNSQVCFYEMLEPLQKYSVEVHPMQQGIYEFTIGVKTKDDEWEALQEKTSNHSFEAISYHKLAAHDGTYSFCIHNQQNKEIKFKFDFKSGIELMDFELLPSNSDAQNLERELSWLEGQKGKLYESLERMEGLKAFSDTFAKLMTTKMIAFAIIGLLMLVIVNVCFYRELKKSLKERKII